MKSSGEAIIIMSSGKDSSGKYESTFNYEGIRANLENDTLPDILKEYFVEMLRQHDLLEKQAMLITAIPAIAAFAMALGVTLTMALR